ncbi:MAG: hypothetical protein ACFWUE_10190 [Xylanivirga thermophila]|nr:hypothetical protein [Xylanivirga thermophila]
MELTNKEKMLLEDQLQAEYLSQERFYRPGAYDSHMEQTPR